MKYELIKKYPGSPDLGFITSPKSDNAYYVNSNWIEPENYPEFWEKVVELDYEILRSCPIEGSIYSVKRLSDNEVFTVRDHLNFNNQGNGILLRIDFERALVDKGKGRLCFVNDNKFLGDWWSIKDLSKVKKSIFVTYDEVDMFMGDDYYTLGTPDNYWSIQKFVVDVNCLSLSPIGKVQFSTSEAAEKYILDNKPKRLYTEDEMVRALENWGMCRVDISYVNNFLNK